MRRDENGPGDMRRDENSCDQLRRAEKGRANVRWDEARCNEQNEKTGDGLR